MTATSVDEYFLLQADWDSPVLYRKQWRTALQSSLVDGEKRSALFTWPRRGLSYNSIAMEYAETAYIMRKIYQNLHNVWGIPYWQDRTYLAAEAASGQAVLTVGSAEYRNFEVGAQCICLEGTDSYEVGTIESFTADQITLTENLTDTWPINTDVYPILKCRIKTGQKFNALTARLGKISIAAQEEYDEITRYTPNIDDFPTYKTHPVLNTAPDWGQPVNTSFLHDYELLSYLGKSYSASHWNETALRFDASYLADGKDEIQSLLDFFDVHKGRWGNFWRPSWVADIVVAEPFTADAIEIEIEEIEYPGYWQDQKAGSHILMLWPDDGYACRGVVRSSTNTISLNYPTGRACTDAQLPQFLVSFLTLCRFTQDEIEAEYVTNSVANINLSCRTTLLEIPTATTTSTTSSSSTSSSSSSTSSSSSSSSTSSTISTTSSSSSTSSTISTTSSSSSTSSTISTTSSSSSTSSTISTTSSSSSTSSTISTTSSSSSTS